MDDATTIGELKKRAEAFVAARDWEQFHTPKNLAMALAGEAAEVMEHFQWATCESSKRIASEEPTRSQVAEELADCFMYLMHFSNRTGIDLSEAVLAKMKGNEERYPVGKCKGSAKKYNQL
mgnify:CR=1 FL=1